MLLLVLFVLLASPTSPTFAHVDKTLMVGAKGRDVIEAVIAKVRSSCLFDNSVQLAKRYAYWSMVRESAEFNGGIWRVPRHVFNDMLERSYFEAINATFQIDFNKANWLHSSIPIYSALAFQLHLKYLGNVEGLSIPGGVEEQGAFLKDHYQDDFVTSELQSVVDDFERATCNDPRTDVAVLVGGSGDQRVKESLKKIVAKFQLGGNTRFSLSQVGNRVQSLFTFSECRDAEACSRGIDELQSMNPNVFKPRLLLEYADAGAFKSETGARQSGVSRVVLVVLGGSLKLVQEWRRIIRKLIYTDQTVIVVGLGGVQDWAGVRARAARVPGFYVCYNSLVVQAKDLEHKLDGIKEKICKAPHIINASRTSFPVGEHSSQRCKIQLSAPSTAIKIRVAKSSTFFLATIYFSEFPYVNKDLYDVERSVVSWQNSTAILSRPRASRHVYCFVDAMPGSRADVEITMEPLNERKEKTNCIERTTHAKHASTTIMPFRSTDTSNGPDEEYTNTFYNHYPIYRLVKQNRGLTTKSPHSFAVSKIPKEEYHNAFYNDQGMVNYFHISQLSNRTKGHSTITYPRFFKQANNSKNYVTSNYSDLTTNNHSSARPMVIKRDINSNNSRRSVTTKPTQQLSNISQSTDSRENIEDTTSPSIKETNRPSYDAERSTYPLSSQHSTKHANQVYTEDENTIQSSPQRVFEVTQQATDSNTPQSPLPDTDQSSPETDHLSHAQSLYSTLERSNHESQTTKKSGAPSSYHVPTTTPSQTHTTYIKTNLITLSRKHGSDNSQPISAPFKSFNCRDKNPCKVMLKEKNPRLYFPHDNSSMFVQCSQWGGCYEMFCPGGMQWNHDVYSCVWDHAWDSGVGLA